MAGASDVNLESEKNQTRAYRCVLKQPNGKPVQRWWSKPNLLVQWMNTSQPKSPKVSQNPHSKLCKSISKLTSRTEDIQPSQPSQLLESKGTDFVEQRLTTEQQLVEVGGFHSSGSVGVKTWKRSVRLKEDYLSFISCQVILNCTKMVAIVQVHTLQAGFVLIRHMDFFRHFVFEVTKSASGQMHVFLERYGSMLPSEVLPGGRCIRW